MQFKAKIKNKAESVGLPAQMVMQSYLFERLLERLSLSRWNEKVILKGGVLISSLVGIASRATMDLDATVRGFALTHENAALVFSEIASVPVDDNWVFSLVRTESIRETDEYGGIRVHLKAEYPPISAPLAVDVSTGDRITPGAVEYQYRLLFDDRSIKVTAYPLETVLAEKLETVISRGVDNTRMRDFYDICILWRTRGSECDIDVLGEALMATSGRRGSSVAFGCWSQTLCAIAKDGQMIKRWSGYVERYPYASGIELNEACCVTAEIMEAIGWR